MVLLQCYCYHHHHHRCHYVWWFAFVVTFSTCCLQTLFLSGYVIPCTPSRCSRSSFDSRLLRWLVGWLTSQQHASVSQGRICSDNCTCCHTEVEAADPTFHLTQSQYTDTGPTSPSADPISPGAWQGTTGVPIFKPLV